MLRPSLIAGFALLLALPLAAQQQDNSSQQQNPPAQSNTQPKKDQPKKSTAQQNPFPEAQSESAAQPQQQGSNPPAAPQPQAAQPGSQSKPSTAAQNPFPEEQSEKAAHQAQQQENPATDTAPPANDDTYSSSQVKGLDMPTTDEQPPANLPPSPLPWNPKLAKKDASVGDFYMESGNWKGAYERFQEANRSDPGNAEAVFGLGLSAQHLHLDDVALRNYHLYLAALPNGPHAKEIHKALKAMGAER